MLRAAVQVAFRMVSSTSSSISSPLPMGIVMTRPETSVKVIDLAGADRVRVSRVGTAGDDGGSPLVTGGGGSACRALSSTAATSRPVRHMAARRTPT
ncbi:MAG TPA: hypothetical protein DCS85_02415 [Verrucomicrobiales bacterium]|nr:hypothetical protein [Verrucomicrobiales bacterium]